MDDVPQIGEKSRMLAECFNRIKRAKRRDEVDDLVATINALMIPCSYTYVDSNTWIHVVMIENEAFLKQLDNSFAGLAPGLPASMHCIADVIWRFNPMTSIWNIIKDRTGTLESLCPIKCGGVPQCKPAAP